jgi:thiaminase
MESDKIMFEVYKEAAYTGRYRVVYFTELNEQNKEFEINRALAGEHFYDGFIRNYKSDDAKEIINSLLDRMNSGEKISPEQFEAAIAAHIPPPVPDA